MSWNSEDVGLAIIGGVLIGAATSIHFLVKGRVTGFSGIVYSIITYDQPSFQWRVALMMGVTLAAAMFFKVYGYTKGMILGATPAFDHPSVLTSIGWGGAVVAGFLVGFGTKLGNGCTSGHGVCGLPRLSIRSIVAVACFMGFGFLTASIKDIVHEEDPNYTDITDYDTCSTVVIVLTSVIIVLMAIIQYFKKKELLFDVVLCAIVGFVFGMGLTISGMVKRSKILGFLTLNEDWDPSLGFVMLGAVFVNAITFRIMDKPLMHTKFEVPTNKVIDWKLVLGSSLFGVGWGIGGFCPGPVFCLFTEFTLQVNLVFMVLLVIGQLSATEMVKYLDNRAQYNQIKPS